MGDMDFCRKLVTLLLSLDVTNITEIIIFFTILRCKVATSWSLFSILFLLCDLISKTIKTPISFCSMMSYRPDRVTDGIKNKSYKKENLYFHLISESLSRIIELK